MGPWQFQLRAVCGSFKWPHSSIPETKRRTDAISAGRHSLASNPTGLKHISKISMRFKSRLKLIPPKNKHVTEQSTAGQGSTRAFGEHSQDIITTALKLSSSQGFKPKEAFSLPPETWGILTSSTQS